MVSGGGRQPILTPLFAFWLKNGKKPVASTTAILLILGNEDKVVKITRYPYDLAPATFVWRVSYKKNNVAFTCGQVNRCTRGPVQVA